MKRALVHAGGKQAIDEGKETIGNPVDELSPKTIDSESVGVSD